MPLKPRPTGLGSGIDKDRPDYAVYTGEHCSYCPAANTHYCSLFEPKDLNMKPEHEARRKIIREWMSLPKDKRQTEEQAMLFAKKAMERIPSSGDPYRQILRWLSPRIGKP